MKKRDQKKQSIKLRAATDFEMEGMHNSFRTIVKHIGGLVNPDNTQVKLQQYLRSSVLQKRKMIEEDDSILKKIQDYYRMHVKIHNDLYGENNPASKFIKYFADSVSDKNSNQNYKRIEILYLRA